MQRQTEERAISSEGDEKNSSSSTISVCIYTNKTSESSCIKLNNNEIHPTFILPKKFCKKVTSKCCLAKLFLFFNIKIAYEWMYDRVTAHRGVVQGGKGGAVPSNNAEKKFIMHPLPFDYLDMDPPGPMWLWILPWPGYGHELRRGFPRHFFFKAFFFMIS